MVVAITCLSCEGGITAPEHGTMPGPGGGGAGGGAGSRAAPVPFTLPVCDPSAAPAPSELQRLTKPELSATLRELVGPTIHAALAPRLTQLPDEDESLGIGQFDNRYTQLHLDLILDLAMDAADRLTATDAAVNALLSSHGASCMLATVTAPCVQSFARAFGLAAFRRPLTAAEVTWAESIYATGITPRDRFSVLVAALVSSPDALYHWELGTVGEGSDLAFDPTPYEIASRLSYSLWGGPPNAALYAAAASGQLSNRTGLETVVAQMLADARGKQRVRDFFAAWLGTANLPGVPSNPNFLAGIDPTGLRDEMKRELEAWLEETIFDRQAGYRELLTSGTSFAATPALAQIYGHAPGAGPNTVDSRRAGLLLRSPFLSSTDDFTHPISRGARLRTQVLCDPLGAPAPEALGAVQVILAPDQVLQYSNRERYTMKTSEAACWGCHQQINALGFALEHFDSVGRYRDVEKNFGGDQQLLVEHPIDSLVTDLRIDMSHGEDAGGARELVDLIAGSQKGPLCLSRQLHRFYARRAESLAGDACELLEAQAALSGGTGSVLAGIRVQALHRATAQRVVIP